MRRRTAMCGAARCRALLLHCVAAPDPASTIAGHFGGFLNKRDNELNIEQSFLTKISTCA